MRNTNPLPSLHRRRRMGFSLFPVTLTASLLSLLVFGYGVFLHATLKPPLLPTPVHGQLAIHTKRTHSPGSKTYQFHSVARAFSAPPPLGDDRSFKAMLLGGAGLLLSSLLALSLARSVGATLYETAQSFLKDERTLWEKKQAVYDAQRDQLIAELQEAQKKREEMNSLRQHASRQFQEFFHTLPVACFCFAANGKIIRWNAACETLYGLPASEALDSTLWETLVLPEELEATQDQVSRVLAGESLLEMERRDRHAAGTVSLVRSSMVPLHDADGAIIGVLTASIGRNKSKQSEQQVSAMGAALEDTRAAIEEARCALAAEQAESARLQASLASAETENNTAIVTPLHDAVTGLWGHRAFHEQMEAEIERAVGYNHPLSAIVLDLDGFGKYNRTLGFEAGDDALKNAAALLASKVRTVDVIARLGADEFAIILPETGQAGARMASERIRSGISGIGAGPVALTACLGIAIYTPDMDNSDAFVDCLRDALFAAKRIGTNRVVQHGEGMIPTPMA